MDYLSYNAEIWSNINESLIDKSTAIGHEEYQKAVQGELKISLAGAGMVPREWFPELKGKDVLGLACGGGQQCPIFAAHGARVTVTDISDGQLLKERYVAEREGYSIKIIKADLSKKFPFPDKSFDFIFNPVSNCYVEDISTMWKECARVIRKGGILMMAFVKEEFFLFDPDFEKENFLITRHTLPFNPVRDLSEKQLEEKRNCKMPLAFSHTLTEQIGGVIQSGFEVTDLYEDGDGGGLFDKYMKSYVAVRAVKK